MYVHVFTGLSLTLLKVRAALGNVQLVVQTEKKSNPYDISLCVLLFIPAIPPTPYVADALSNEAV